MLLNQSRRYREMRAAIQVFSKVRKYLFTDKIRPAKAKNPEIPSTFIIWTGNTKTYKFWCRQESSLPFAACEKGPGSQDRYLF